VSKGWSTLIGSAQLCKGVDRGCAPPPPEGPRPTTDEEQSGSGSLVPDDNETPETQTMGFPNDP